MRVQYALVQHVVEAGRIDVGVGEETGEAESDTFVHLEHASHRKPGRHVHDPVSAIGLISGKLAAAFPPDRRR